MPEPIVAPARATAAVTAAGAVAGATIPTQASPQQVAVDAATGQPMRGVPISPLEAMTVVSPALHPILAAEQARALSPAEQRVAGAGRSLQSLVETGQAKSAQAPAAGRPAQSAAKALVSKPAAGTDAKALTQAVMKASNVSSLPPWFEEAARKLLAGDSSQDMSFEELVLVSTAGPGAMAASGKGPSSGGSAPQADAAGGTGTGETYGAPPAPDVEVMAREIYDEILKMMDAARERIGDPWEKI
jgi:hypothetical protein